MAAIQSNGTGGGDWDAGASWAGGTAPGAGDDATILNGDTITQTQDEEATSVTIDSGGELDISTYDLDVSGAVSISGLLRMGNSSNTGLSCGAFTTTSPNAMTLQNNSDIHVLGNVTLAEVSFTTFQKGHLYVDADITYTETPTGNRWRSITIAATKTMSINSSSQLMGFGSQDLTINGTLACGANQVIIGGNGTVTIGVNGDITGTNVLRTVFNNPTFVCNNVAALSFSGTIDQQRYGGGSVTGWVGDFSNADVEFSFSSPSLNLIFTMSSGTMKCKNLTISDHSTYTLTIDNSVNNTSYEVSGNINLSKNGNGTTVWTKGTGTITLANAGSGTQTVYFNDQSIEDLVVNDAGATKQLTGDTTIESLTVTAGTFDIQTYDCDVSGAVSIDGNLTMGTSSNTGLTCAGFTTTSSNALTLGNNSNIHVTGNVTLFNSSFTTFQKGHLYVDDDINYNDGTTNNRWRDITIAATKTMTLTDLAQITGFGSYSTTINGTLAVGTNTILMGGNGTVTIGANGDITGNGNIETVFNTPTFVDNKSGPLSFSGNIKQLKNAGGTIKGWVRDFSNANCEFSFDASTSNLTFSMDSGTLKCKNLNINDDSTYTLTVDNSVNNTSYEISGDVDFDANGNGTAAWTKGTGTITLTGAGSGTQTLDFDGKTVEDLVINDAGTTKSIASDFTCGSLTLTALDTLNSDSVGTQRTITFTGTEVSPSGTSFQDISTGLANQINGKDGAINLGNTKGIVFKDTLGKFTG